MGIPGMPWIWVLSVAGWCVWNLDIENCCSNILLISFTKDQVDWKSRAQGHVGTGKDISKGSIPDSDCQVSQQPFCICLWSECYHGITNVALFKFMRAIKGLWFLCLFKSFTEPFCRSCWLNKLLYLGLKQWHLVVQGSCDKSNHDLGHLTWLWEDEGELPCPDYGWMRNLVP